MALLAWKGSWNALERPWNGTPHWSLRSFDKAGPTIAVVLARPPREARPAKAPEREGKLQSYLRPGAFNLI